MATVKAAVVWIALYFTFCTIYIAIVHVDTPITAMGMIVVSTLISISMLWILQPSIIHGRAGLAETKNRLRDIKFHFTKMFGAKH